MGNEKPSDFYPLFDYCKGVECVSFNRKYLDMHFGEKDFEAFKEILMDCSESCKHYASVKRGQTVTA